MHDNESNGNVVREKVERLERDHSELAGRMNQFIDSVNEHMLSVMTQLAVIESRLKDGNPQCKTHSERIDRLEKETREMNVAQNKWVGGLAVLFVVIQVLLALFGPSFRSSLGVGTH